MNAVNEMVADVIETRTWEMAIENGELIDVTMSNEWVETGFKCPVALSRMVWYKYVEVPEGVWGPNQQGILRDILSVYNSTVQSRRQNKTVYFEIFVPNADVPAGVSVVTLKGVRSPDDDGNPAITILERYED
jgi:hypothetical protein